MNLTFAEQVREMLKKRNMTIEQLAEKLSVSRQNLNQKLNRNNFDEQTMRTIAIALECDFFVSLDGINNKIKEDITDNSGIFSKIQQTLSADNNNSTSEPNPKDKEIREKLLFMADMPESAKEIIRRTKTRTLETDEQYLTRIVCIHDGHTEPTEVEQEEDRIRSERMSLIHLFNPRQEGEENFEHVKRVVDIYNNIFDDK